MGICKKLDKRVHTDSILEFHVNHSQKDLPDNKILTSKYSLITFLPKFLFFQFSRFANLYFLLVGVFQTISAITSTDGRPLIYIPLTFVLCVSGVKEIIEDFKRKKSDRAENFNKVMKYEHGKFQTAKWQDLRVGDIIKVVENQYMPADLILLYSSGRSGTCFIETKNLDGETNLKNKQADKRFMSQFSNEEEIQKFQGTVHCELPNPYLYSFKGKISFESEIVPLSEQSFLLRGSSLRNTDYIIGVITYTGHNTKIMLNSGSIKQKISSLEKDMNRQIAKLIILQVLICLFGGIYAASWHDYTQLNTNYLLIKKGTRENNYGFNLFVRSGNWLILMNAIIPISLVITLEMVKIAQGLRMMLDKGTSSVKSHQSLSVQSSNLNEELGQVEYVFSDKTGTLTENKMEFKKICLAGREYGNDHSYDISTLPRVTNVNFADQFFIEGFKNPDSRNYEEIKEALILLATCHTIFAHEKNGKLIYDATSQDELALVNFAKFVGVEYIGTDENNIISLKIKDEILKYEVLNSCEFTSTRKRMSVILRTPEDRIILFMKGADGVVLDRINHSANIEEISHITEQLIDYSKEGLRTLLIAKKELDEQTYKEWNQRYHEALRDIHEKEKRIEKLQEEIETKLVLIGATGIEDDLQDEVGITISKLKEANIKTWVLTGDKIETAVNIGYSCSLLNENMVLIYITDRDKANVKQKLNDNIEMVKALRTNNFGLIVSGDSLVHITHDHELAKELIDLAQACKAVLICRASPKQKSEIVCLVRKFKPNSVTLAIGDGANDVNMISAAHVGIGIKGLEGKAAARASDYAIGEFKILQRILLYHGRESYRKNSQLILFNFYKNVLLNFPQFIFGFYSGFSGTNIYDPIVVQGYNVLFATLPIIIYSIFDIEFQPEVFIRYPKLYLQGPECKLFGTQRFWRWILLAITNSIAIFYSVLFSYSCSEAHSRDGRTDALYEIGMGIFSQVVWMVNIIIITFSKSINIIMLLMILLTAGSYILGFFIVSKLSVYIYGAFSRTFGNMRSNSTAILVMVFLNVINYAVFRYQKLKTHTEFQRKAEDPIHILESHPSPARPLQGDPINGTLVLNPINLDSSQNITKENIAKEQSP